MADPLWEEFVRVTQKDPEPSFTAKYGGAVLALVSIGTLTGLGLGLSLMLTLNAFDIAWGFVRSVRLSMGISTGVVTVFWLFSTFRAALLATRRG